MQKLIFLAAIMALTPGCEKIYGFMPKRATTDAEMRALIAKCLSKPDRLPWTVQNGAFVYPTFTNDASRLTPAERDCVLGWTERHRVKTVIMG
jgi:hypothetical protein